MAQRNSEINIFRIGSYVWLIRSTHSGIWYVEGKARIIRHLGGNLYRVRFPDGGVVERRLDAEAQTDPWAVVRARNNAAAEAA